MGMILQGFLVPQCKNEENFVLQVFIPEQNLLNCAGLQTASSLADDFTSL